MSSRINIRDYKNSHEKDNSNLQDQMPDSFMLCQKDLLIDKGKENNHCKKNCPELDYIKCLFFHLVPFVGILSFSFKKT